MIDKSIALFFAMAVLLPLRCAFAGPALEAEELGARPTIDWLAAAAEHCSAIPQGDVQSHALYELAYVQARSNRLAEGLASAHSVAKPSHRTAVMAFIALRQREAGDIGAARATLAEANRRALAEATVDSGGFGDCTLVRTLAEMGQVEDAEAFIRALPRRFGPTIEMTVLAEQLARQGDLMRALAVVRQLDARHWPQSLSQVAGASESLDVAGPLVGMAMELQDPAERDQALENLAKAFAEQGHFDGAEEIANRVSAETSRARAKGTLLSYWAANQPAAALADRLSRVDSREEKLPLLQKLIEALAREGRVEEAEATIAQAAALIRESPRPTDNSAFGRFDDAAALAVVNANYLLTAAALHARGDHAAAQDRIDHAAKAIFDMPRELGITKIMLVNQLVATMIDVGDLAAARATVTTQDSPINLAVERVAIALAEAGDAAAALETARLIPGESRGRGRSFGDVAAAMIKAGDASHARKLLGDLGGSNEDAAGFRDAGRAMIESGGAVELEEWLTQMPLEVHRAYACLGAAEAQHESELSAQIDE